MFLRWFKRQKSLADLEERLKSLEDARKLTALEWDEMYEKFRLLYVRLSKRVKRLDESSVQTEGTQPEESGESTSPPTSLTPRALQAQQLIMMRRNRRMGGS